MRRSLIGTLTALTMLCGACGSDGGPSSADDAKLAERVALRVDDLGGDWAEDTSGDEDDEDDDLDLPAECDDLQRAFGDNEDFDGQTAEFDSTPLLLGDLETTGQQLTMDSSIAVGEDEQALADVLELFNDERLPGCLATAFETGVTNSDSGLPPDAELAPVEVATPDPPDAGDEAVSYVLSTAIRLPDFEVPVRFAFIVVRRGRVGAQLSVSAIGAPLPDDDIARALDAMVERIDGELA